MQRTTDPRWAKDRFRCRSLGNTLSLDGIIELHVVSGEYEPMAISTTLTELFEQRGDSQYGGEQVTQLQHALQCAQLAEQTGATTDQIVAALLHDIGHLLHDLPEDAPDQGIDDHHENRGNAYLKKRFPASVCEPVRLHVAAKRYLCAVDEDYYGKLSEASVQSLKLQGGPMSPDDIQVFESGPFWKEAVELRRWDDMAKQIDLPTPTLEHYLPLADEISS